MGKLISGSFWQFFRGNGKLGRDAQATQREFQPAALEVQESPPSPSGRLLLWIILVLFTLLILWSALGAVDVVVTAAGRVVPNGQVKIVQAITAGTVKAIHVRDSKRIEVGQPLVSLNSIYTDADLRRVAQKLSDLEWQLRWRAALDEWLAGNRGNTGDSRYGESVSNGVHAPDEALYWQRRAQISATFLALENELQANSAEQAALSADRLRTVATLAILKERVLAYRTLLDKKYGARVQYLELLQQQTDLEQSVPAIDARTRMLVNTGAALAARVIARAGEIRNQNLLEVAQLESERAALFQEHQKALQRQSETVLRAPVTGTVQEMTLHTVGGVVSPAQVLMKIVPENTPVEIEVLLENKDMGFVVEGQLAEVKVDTYNFTKYGLLDAVVLSISKDAVEDPNLGWVFRMRLRLESDQLIVNERIVTLSSGMAVTAEIKTGSRRLLEFFLSPLLRYKQESIRER